MKIKIGVLLVFVLIVTVSITVFNSCKNDSTEKVTIDYSSSEGEIMYGATGFLYGMAEPDVPDGNLLKAIEPQIACVKPPEGLQHPIGDILNVAPTFLQNGGEKLFVYMQDSYADWYYKYEGQEDYLQKIEKIMENTVSTDYADKIIYCPFNENDNGEWYGDFKDDESRQKFYEDWTAAFKLIRQYNPDAVIAGPGYMRYDHEYIEDFLKYCKSNDVMPDMMVWHELSDKSYYEFEEHYEDYREVEKQLGISEMPICISEYGEMRDNGIPGKMLQYISMYESKKVYACIAFWRLADNLGELAADNNMPSAAWWLYHWYSQMQGNTYSALNDNEKKSEFRAISSYSEEAQELTILAGGANSDFEIELENLNSLSVTSDNDYVTAEIYYVDFNGLGGECLNPVHYKTCKIPVSDARAVINIDNSSESKAYKIVISKDDISDYNNENLPVRYEAENTKINGLSFFEKFKSVTDDAAYAISGKIVKNVSGEGKSLDFTISVPEDGMYSIGISYANGQKNDGTNNTRTFLNGSVLVDGTQKIDLTYPNTLSDSTTSYITLSVELSKGEHVISLTADEGAMAYDFIDIVKTNVQNAEYVAEKLKNGTTYMFAVPQDGTYHVEADTNCKISFENQSAQGTSFDLFMQKGINFIECKGDVQFIAQYMGEASIKPVSVKTVGDFTDANLVNGKENYIEISVNAVEEGLYAIVIPYSNNAQSGTHDYNVKLVERYAQIECSTSYNVETVYFRNTYSWDEYKIKIIYITLKKGENVIKIYNDNSIKWNNENAYLPVINYENIVFEKAIG